MATQKPKTKEQRRARRKVLERKPRHRVEVVSGVAGLSLYLNGTRVAGEKPWGGGRLLHVFEIDDGEFEKARSVLSNSTPKEGG